MTPGTFVLLCDMNDACVKPVRMIDNKGFVYCEDHGLQRRSWCPCRKLRPHEIRRLERGEQIARY